MIQRTFHRSYTCMIQRQYTCTSPRGTNELTSGTRRIRQCGLGICVRLDNSELPHTAGAGSASARDRDAAGAGSASARDRDAFPTTLPR